MAPFLKTKTYIKTQNIKKNIYIYKFLVVVLQRKQEGEKI